MHNEILSLLLLFSFPSLPYLSSLLGLPLEIHLCIFVGGVKIFSSVSLPFTLPRWSASPALTQNFTYVVFLCCHSGSLPVGRWGTQPSSGGTCSATLSPWCLSSREAYACWAGGPRRNSSLIPSSKSTAHTYSSLPLWEVGGSRVSFSPSQ